MPPVQSSGRSSGAEKGNTEPRKVSLISPPSPGTGDSDTDFDLMDMNGDGLPDRVYQGSTLKVAINTGYGFLGDVAWGSGNINHSTSTSISFGLFGIGDSTDSFKGGASLSRNNNYGKSRLMDMNGDGLPDYASVSGSNIHVYYNTGYAFETTPAIFTGALSTYSLDKNSEEETVVPGNVYLSDGASTSVGVNGSYSHSITFYAVFVPFMDLTFSIGGDKGATVSRPTITYADVNGDGFTDSIRSNSGSNFTVALSQIGKTNLLRQINRPMGATISLDYERSGNTFDQPSSKWVMSKTAIYDGIDDKVNGKGADTQIIEYDYKDGYHDRAERDFYGYRQVTEAYKDGSSTLRKVVRNYLNKGYAEKGLMVSESMQDGADKAYRSTSNKYEIYDVSGNRKLFELDADTDYEFNRGTIDPGLRIFPRLVRTDSRTYEPGAKQYGKSGTEQHTYTEQSYDTYGNVISFFDAGDSDVSSDDIYATIEYHQDRSAWIMGKPSRITVTDNAGTSLRERRASYESGSGNLTRIEQYLANGGIAETDLSYDSYGNIATVTGPRDDNNQRREFAFSYDDRVHTHVVRIDDRNFGYHSEATYDLNFGKVLNTTDLNGNAMSYTYDIVGRVETITGPYEQGGSIATIAFDYHPEAAVPYAHTRHLDPEHSGNLIETVLFTDGLKRVLQTKKDSSLYQGTGRAAKEGRSVSGRVVFDALGRTVAQYYPTVDGGNTTAFYPAVDSISPTRTYYDALDRSIGVVLPDGSITTTEYSFGADRNGQTQAMTTVVDAEGNQKRTYKDARQLITSVEEQLIDENNGNETLWTSYAYDAMKQITLVRDAQNNLTRVAYDNLGRRLSIDNPDMGKVEMIYDLAGNMIHKITANHRVAANDGKPLQRINYLYDHGRLKEIRYPGFPTNNVAYEYGAPNAPDNRAGRITKVSHQAGTEERWYGKLGEMVKELDTILVTPPGGKGGNGQNRPELYTTRYQYDSWGRIKQLTYPDGDLLNYHYDAGGQVNRITGNKAGVESTFIERIQYDKFEQRKQIKYGNGVETTYDYDPQRRYLERLQSAGKQGKFQNLSYQFDRVGNILSRTNDVDPINGIGGYSKQEYGYDSLYRLTSASGRYQQDAQQGHERYSLNMRYDAIHNIRNKNQQHTRTSADGIDTLIKGTSYNWDYQYKTGGSNKPHAPTIIGDRTFRYDANGNQLGWSNDKQNRQIQWDDENRIQRIEDDTRITTFAYDDKGQRVIKQTKRTNSGTGKETLYLNQYYQLANRSVVTKHVFVGSSRMLTKHSGGSIVFRQSAKPTREKANNSGKRLPHFRDAAQGGANVAGGRKPGATKAANDPQGKTKVKNDKAASAPGYIKQAARADKTRPEQANNDNGKSKKKDKANDKKPEKVNNKPNKETGKFKDGQHPGQGLEHRSDRANEVAQNVNKNPNLQYLKSDPDSPYYEGGDANGNLGDASQSDIDGYIGEEALIIGPASEKLYYFHPDHLGSTAYVTDEDGDLAEHLEYFPFGESWVQEGGNKASNYLYTSKEYDSETGLYYYGARYYDPRTSIWVSPDPILEKYLPTGDKEKDKDLPGLGGIYNTRNLGLYGYAAVNPVRYSDPDGNIIWGAIIGAGVEIASQLATKGEVSDWNAVGVSAVVGLVTGGIGGKLATKAAKGMITSSQAVAGTAATSGVSSGLGSVTSDKLNGKEVDVKKAAVSSGFGLLGGVFGGKSANATTAKLEQMSAKGGLSAHVADTTNSAMIGKAAEKITSAGQAVGEATPHVGLSIIQKKAEQALE